MCHVTDQTEMIVDGTVLFKPRPHKIKEEAVLVHIGTYHAKRARTLQECGKSYDGQDVVVSELPPD
jgi:hypothetical protein